MSEIAHALSSASSADSRSPRRAPLPKRFLVLLYGGASYAVGVSSLVALILIMLGVLEFTGGFSGKLGTLRRSP